MDNRKKQDKNPPVKTIVWVILALILIFPEVLLPIGVIAALVYVVYRIAKQNSSGAEKNPPVFEQKRPAALEQKAPAFDECPQPICFHKDKGEHHVKKGKEVDPWDRPDIDISKYQRR